MTPEDYKRRRGSFWVQFTCGAILGVFFGVSVARSFADSFLTAALIFVAAVGIRARNMACRIARPVTPVRSLMTF